MGRTHAASPSSSPAPRGRATASPFLPKFATFVSTVLSRAEVTLPTLLVSLVYIHRARPHLSIALEEWALERVFLGALICASKYTNDSTLKNVHWALCTGVFGKRDVGRIEREFLDVLDWELGVREADLLAHHEGLVAAATRSRSAALASRTKIVLKSTVVRSAKPTYLAPPARHHGHVRRPSVPELEPSSPQSSLASMSPRTPSSYPHSPASPRRHTHRPHHSRSSSSTSSSSSSSSANAYPRDVPMDVDPSSTKGGKWNDLLRAFPIPVARSHHLQRHGGYAIHVNA
jgi:hypothetical protein